MTDPYSKCEIPKVGSEQHGLGISARAESSVARPRLEVPPRGVYGQKLEAREKITTQYKRARFRQKSLFPWGQGVIG